MKINRGEQIIQTKKVKLYAPYENKQGGADNLDKKS